MTKTLEVQHTLQWHRPMKEQRAIPWFGPIKARHAYTHMLVGAEHECLSGTSGPPLKQEETTALLINRGLGETPLHVCLLGLGGRDCAKRVQCATVNDVSRALSHVWIFLFISLGCYPRFVAEDFCSNSCLPFPT